MGKTTVQPLLKNGSKGSDVKKLQQSLINAGYNVGNAGADGIYGANTAAAVKQYQKDNGLAVDGIAGNNTLGSLYSTPQATNALNTLAKGSVLGAQIAAGNTKANQVTAANQGLKAMAQGSVAGAQTAAGAPVTTLNVKGKDSVRKAVNLDEADGPSEYPTNDSAENPPAETTGGTGFSVDPYQKSEIVQQADALLAQHNASAPTYSSQWQAQINEYLNKIMNREEFSYNFNEDALYQQYKDIYTQMGLMAMMDTMGQASTMTGGYGNSYAQTVGQQAYNQQLSQLNNVLPELYQMAFDRYAYEGDQLYNQYGMLMDQENMDYNRYLDSYNQWANTRDYLAGQANTLYQQEWNEYLASNDQAWNEYTANYQEGRDTIDDQRYDKEWMATMISGYGYEPSDEELAAVGMTRGEYEALKGAYNDQKVEEENNNTGKDKPRYDNGGLSDNQVNILQSVFGVEEDGKWGEKSKAAANGMSATEAWGAYVRGELNVPADPAGSISETRKMAIEEFVERMLTNGNVSSGFDPIKLIDGSSFLLSDDERNYAKEIINLLASMR